MFDKKPVAVKFRNNKNLDVPAATTQQMKEEIGDQTLTDAQLTMLKQKYGIVPPVLSGMEINLIVQAGRRAA